MVPIKSQLRGIILLQEAFIGIASYDQAYVYGNIED